MACLSVSGSLASSALVSRLGYGKYDTHKVFQPINAYTLRPRDIDSFYIHHCRFAKNGPNKVTSVVVDRRSAMRLWVLFGNHSSGTCIAHGVLYTVLCIQHPIRASSSDQRPRLPLSLGQAHMQPICPLR